MRPGMISRRASPLARTLATAMLGLGSLAGLTFTACAQAAPGSGSSQMLEWMQRAHQPAAIPDIRLATLYRQHREIGHLRGEQGRAAPVEPVRQPPLAHGPDLPETY